MAKAQRQIVVCNKHGLHARPAMQLVELANRFESDVTLTKAPERPGGEPTVADAKSVMAVITLAATKGTQLDLLADGEDAEEAVAQVGRLFEEKFGEEE